MIEDSGLRGHDSSDTSDASDSLLQVIGDGTPFVAVRDQYLAYAEVQSDLIPLPRIGELMVEPLAPAMVDKLGKRLHCGIEMGRIEVNPQGFASYDSDNRLRASSDQLLFCCGGDDTALDELQAWRDRWEGSARFLSRTNLDGLPLGKDPIVIIGASHSAFCCAWRLLNDPLFVDFADAREIVILHRRERFKLCGSVEFANSHQLEYDPENDVCPITSPVFFNAGLRKDAKFLYLDIRDGREKRARLQPMGALAEQHQSLTNAGLILQATGFTHKLPLIERDGRAIKLGDPSRNGELRDLDSGEIVAGCYGLDLGFNILPERESRGEPSFSGGIHGFHSYPLAVAPPIIDRLIENLPAEASN